MPSETQRWPFAFDDSTLKLYMLLLVDRERFEKFFLSLCKRLCLPSSAFQVLEYKHEPPHPVKFGKF
jgi:hypothetical protein